MSIFTRLRIALDLAARIEAIEQHVATTTAAQNQTIQNLQFEWTDVLDKLLAREERWRKRYKAEVGHALDHQATAAPAARQNESPAMGGSDKGALRIGLTALRAQGK